MKKIKIRNIAFFILVFMIITLIASYHIESRSKKLPAVIQSEKVFIATEANGIIREFFVSSMQEVMPNEAIAIIDNPRYHAKLEHLKSERLNYLELIESARSGDHLKLELNDLEEDIQRRIRDRQEAEIDLQKTIERMPLFEQRYLAANRKFKAQKRLYEKNLITNMEYEKFTESYWRIQRDYENLKADSLSASSKIVSANNIIDILQDQKELYSQNVNLLASRYVINLKEVEAEISDVEEDINNLMIYSPIRGIVTDINYQPGERIGRGREIVEIADLSRVWIIAYSDSFNRHRAQIGQKVKIYTGSGKKIWGKVVTISPVMERVKYLTTSFETANTYTKIEIAFDDQEEALQYLTPGERLFVRIYFR